MGNNNEFLSNQLIKLGDMMGDGLHHEPDGAWITKEYNKIFKILHPEVAKEKRKHKADNINNQMANLIENIKCSHCQGKLRQSRSGSIICYCDNCNLRFKAKKKKK